MPKIEPLRGRFENMQAFLHHIAEDSEVVSFVGCIMRGDGQMVPVQFNATREQMSFAAAMWLRLCQENE